MTIVDLHSSLDLMRADFACCFENKIEVHDNTIAIWKSSELDIGWQVLDNKLYRSEGKFDYKKKQWNWHKNYLMADQIEKIITLYDKENHSVALTIYYGGKPEENINKKLAQAYMKVGMND